VAHLEKLTSLTEISEIELWILDGSDTALIKRLKAKAVEILQKSKPRTVCKCNNTMDVDLEPFAKQEPEPLVKRELGSHVQQGLGLKREDEEIKPAGCRCKPPKRVFRLRHLVRKHGQWGTPFWGSERVEETEVPPLEE
jgi:hypothetical protein